MQLSKTREPRKTRSVPEKIPVTEVLRGIQDQNLPKLQQPTGRGIARIRRSHYRGTNNRGAVSRSSFTVVARKSRELQRYRYRIEGEARAAETVRIGLLAIQTIVSRVLTQL